MDSPIPGSESFPYDFSGDTYEEDRDQLRLSAQLDRTYQAMKDGKWRTIPEILQITGDRFAPSISARLRDFRKERFGSHVVNRRYIKDGLWEYQFEQNPETGLLWIETEPKEVGLEISRKFNIHPSVQKPSTCRGCPLEHSGTGFARPDGTGSIRVLIVGEALGPNEAREGLGFRPYAPAGSVLERAFRMSGFTRDQFVIFNIVNCLPPNMELAGAPYEMEAAQHCRVHLLQVIRQFRPKCILALGAVALRSLTGMAGKKQSIEHLRGFALSSPEAEFDGIPIVSSFHPSYIVRGAWNVFPILCRDLKYAVSVAKNGFHPPAVEFYEQAGLSEIEWLKERCSMDEELAISVDFETEVNINVFEDQQLMGAMEELYGEEDAKKKLKKKDKIGTEQPITQINISVKEYESFVFQASSELMQGCAELFAMSNPKITYNGWNFDGPVAVWNGMPLAGDHYDVIWMFHHLWPDLPGKKGKVQGELEGSLANLQFAASMYGWWMPWKHLVDERPEYYGCHDSAATLMLRNAVMRDMKTLRYGTDGPTVWDGYMSMVHQIQPILEKMKVRGLPVNKEKMLGFLKSVVMRQRGVSEEIQKVVPDVLCTTSPKEGYAKRPTKKCETCKGMGVQIVRDNSGSRVTCIVCDGNGRVDKTDSLVLRDFHFEAEEKRCKCFKIRKKDVEYWANVPGAEIDAKDKLRAPDPECPQCGGAMDVTPGWIALPERTETRWCKLEPFNPNSPDQMRAYAAFHHHAVPKNSKKKYAMDKETVEKLAKSTGDPLYKECVRFREFEKMRTYALGWMPTSPIARSDMEGAGEDGKIGYVHSAGSFFPATGQLSYTNPNLQTAPNVGKYGILAEEFRDGIEAPDGYVLIEADMKSYHAQTLGFEANCPAYIRLAKIDIHSYLATRMIKAEHSEYALEWSDGELKEWLGWYRKNFHLADGTPFKKIRDKQAKPGILGYGFGLGAGKLYRLNEDSFKDEKEAKYVLDTLDATFPEVKTFRDQTPLIAKKQGSKLISRYGCPRWFWDLQSWNSQEHKYVHGTDWERAIAFLPANVAFCHMKLAMKRLEDSGASERFGLILNIHDALLWLCPKLLMDEAMYTMKTEMERQSEYMLFKDGTGLSVEVEVKVGRTWNAMKEVTI